MEMTDLPLGQIARQIPGATAVLHHYQLDFCCGGKKTLSAAIAERQLNPQEIVAALEELMQHQGAEVSWSEADDNTLINHILTRYHQVHREQLKELIRLADRVETVHGDRTDCPLGLTQHLQIMQQDLEQHMQKEENILFPMLQRGQRQMAEMPIQIMRHEHDDHGSHLAVLDELTNSITLPKGACNTWRALYLGLQTFKTDLMQHIHLENNVLFERAESVCKT